ncbi:unnamed protein product, partial [Porites lobata]
VIINYPSGSKRRLPKDDVDRKAIKQLVLGEYGYAVNALYSKKVVRDALLEKVCGSVIEECKDLCSVRKPSILRDTTPEGLKQFTESAHVTELSERAPVLYTILSSAAGKPVISKARNQNGENETNDESNTATPAISMAASILLKKRCPQMSAQAYRFSTVLWHSGAKKQVYNRGVKWGVTVSHTSVIEKIEQMGKRFYEKVLNWKVQQEYHKRFTATLATIKECVEEAVPTVEPTSDRNLKKAVEDKLGQQKHFIFDENIYSEVETLIKKTTRTELVSNTSMETLSMLMQQSDSERPLGYQIIEDNVDLMIKVRHQASDKPNKSIHWFHLNAVKDRVSGAGLSEKGSIKLVDQVENWEILPSYQDNEGLLHDFIPLFARVICDRIPALKSFKDVVIRHIPHKYSNVTKQKSEQAPLGLLFKNENTNDDMIDILTELHQRYLPVMKTTDGSGNVEIEVLQKVFFGGDQLTEERARNARQGRADGDTEFERLEGLIPKVEDWHAGRVLYQVLYDVFFNPSSANDVGTMCSNMNVINQVNAKTSNVLDNFNHCKTYVKLETDAFITAATMKHFGMTNLEEPAGNFIPPSILDGSQSTRRIWLHKQVKDILKKAVIDEQEQFHATLQNELIELNRPKRFYCRVCNKEYRYAKARDSHENNIHSFSIELASPEESSDSMQPLAEHKPVDARYNYACARLNFGMLLYNFDDAIKEGDGDRILRCWKFMLLIFRAYKHTKYAFAALQLFFYTSCMLSERMSHLLVWNRTVNNHGGKGRNISLDLRLEHLNNLLKEMLRCLGVNVTEKSAKRCGEAMSILEEMLHKIDVELGVKEPSGHHITADDQDFAALVKEIHERGGLFSFNPSSERNYEKFPDFQRNILSGLDFNQLNKWLNSHKKDMSRLQQ